MPGGNLAVYRVQKFASDELKQAMTGLLEPVHVFIVAFGTGLLRPSDMVMRNALIADTIPGAHLANALGLARMSMDSAKMV